LISRSRSAPLALGRRERLGEQRLDAFGPEATAPLDQARRVTGQLVLEVEAPAEVLPVRVLDEPGDDRLITLVEEVLEVVEPDHQARRQAGSANIFRVKCAEFGFEAGPVNGLG